MSKNKPSWKKFRPESCEEVEALLSRQKQLTAYWYDRISGKIAWKPDEKEAVNEMWDKSQTAIEQYVGRQELATLNETQSLNMI